jgi:hypothetical protein
MVAATYDNIKFTNEMAANQPHNIAIIWCQNATYNNIMAATITCDMLNNLPQGSQIGNTEIAK